MKNLAPGLVSALGCSLRKFLDCIFIFLETGLNKKVTPPSRAAQFCLHIKLLICQLKKKVNSFKKENPCVYAEAIDTVKILTPPFESELTHMITTI